MEKIIELKRWSNMTAFIKVDDLGNIYISAKWYDEYGKGHFIDKTKTLANIDDMPKMPEKKVESVFINTFKNHLRRIFTPNKVRYSKKIINQTEIDEAENQIELFLKPIWEKAKKEYSWLNYPL